MENFELLRNIVISVNFQILKCRKIFKNKWGNMYPFMSDGDRHETFNKTELVKLIYNSQVNKKSIYRDILKYPNVEKYRKTNLGNDM